MKSASERHLSLAPSRNAEASRSKAAPSVVRTSQPSPTRILVMLGSAFLSERFSPFLSVIDIRISPVCLHCARFVVKERLAQHCANLASQLNGTTAERHGKSA